MNASRHSADAVSDLGFTLVEIIVSIVLLGLAALVILPAIVTGSRSVVINRDISRATQYASAELTTARGMTCAAVVAALATPGSNLSGNPAGYTVSDTVTVTGSCGGSGTYRLSTTVTSATDASRSATATTLILATP